jgi:prolyl oligopeptidase PreP (S9A serine peptidase family)
MDYQRNSYFAVSSFFKEIEVGTKAYDKNREKVYKGSSKHLFKNAVEKKWNKKEFMLFDGSFVTNADEHFEISDELNMKKIKIKPKQEEKITNQKIQFFRSFNLLYNNSDQSKVIFRTDEFFVDEFGNHTHIDKIEFSGVISEKRFGDMLPLNYVPR